MTSMTAKEAKAAFTALRKEAGGSRSWIHVGMNDYGEKALYCRIYPNGASEGCACEGTGDTWEELLADTRELWAESAARHCAARTRKMALEIIRITAERGTCTDADLRAELFSAEEVAQLGSEAVYDANKIASNGPFELVRLAGANAA